MKLIDLRSDTVTLQPAEMIEAMSKAIVGDDVYGEDPAINELEALACKITGKKAALFVLSGVMGNEIALMSQTNQGDVVLLSEDAHIANHESGAPAVLAKVNLRTINNPDHLIYPEDIHNHKTDSNDILQPKTSLLVEENALSDGTVMPLALMKANYAYAKENELSVHLDGARLFNAALSLGVDVKDICNYCDTVMFCLSKGLCAPIGSILAGPSETINKARKFRKMLGGGIRQGGYLAQAGIYALQHQIPQLKKDHENAQYLVNKLKNLREISCDPAKVQINLIYFSINKPNFDHKKFVHYLKSNRIIINPSEHDQYRFATHYLVTREDCDYIYQIVESYFKEN